MSWDTVFTKENMPSFEDVSEYINNPLWLALHTILIDTYKANPKVEYRGCSLPGWNIKYKRKGKSLCTVYPQVGNFKVLVIANKIHQKEIEDMLVDVDLIIQKEYQKTPFLNGAKWLFVDIDKQSILDDIIKLIDFRTY